MPIEKPRWTFSNQEALLQFPNAEIGSSTISSKPVEVGVSANLSFGGDATPSFAINPTGSLSIAVLNDLADVDADRATHPGRVLARSPLAPFHLALAVLTLSAFIVSVTRPMALAGILLLDAAFLYAYWRLRRHVRDEVWRFGILLLKYPAVVAIAALVASDSVEGLRLVLAAAAA